MNGWRESARLADARPRATPVGAAEQVGGCDIITEMYQAEELEPLVKGAGRAAQKAGEDAE